MWNRLKAIAAMNQCIIIALLVTVKVPPHPQRYSTPEFPLIAQPDDISCGPTSCTMLLTYFGKPMDVPEAKKLAHTTWLKYKGVEVGMTMPDGIAAVLNAAGIPAKIQHGSIEKLKYYISQDKLPIVLLRSGYKTWHYVVAIGYTETSIIIADPGGGNREEIIQSAFIGAWKFTHDMSGEAMPAKFDPYFEAVKMADVYGETYVVPNCRSIL